MSNRASARPPVDHRRYARACCARPRAPPPARSLRQGVRAARRRGGRSAPPAPGAPQQAKAPLLRPGMRALVRQDDSGLVRLGAKSARRLARRATPSGPTVLLGEPPARGLFLAYEDALRQPRRPECRRLHLAVDEREVDDVVRASSQVPVTRRRVEHVVRRGHERGERPGALLVVAHSLERSHLRHGAGRYQPHSALDSTPWRLSSTWLKTASSRERTRWRESGGCARAPAPTISRSSSSTRAAASRAVWHDVDLLDGRFSEGDAVRVLGRVERYRNQLQLDVRAIEPAEGADPAELTPALRRDADELEGFLDFLAGEISHPGLKAVVTTIVGDGALRRAFRRYLPHRGASRLRGGLLEHTVGVATICRSSCSFIRGCGRTSCSAQGSCTMSAVRAAEAGAGVPGHRRGPAARSRPSRPAARRGAVGEARRRRPGRVAARDRLPPRARAARTAEAACLYHANQLDARPLHAQSSPSNTVTGLGSFAASRFQARSGRAWSTRGAALRIDRDHGRLPGDAEALRLCGSCPRPRPLPAVPLEEVASAIACVGDIQPEVAELRVLLTQLA